MTMADVFLIVLIVIAALLFLLYLKLGKLLDEVRKGQQNASLGCDKIDYLVGILQSN